MTLSTVFRGEDDIDGGNSKNRGEACDRANAKPKS